MASLTMLVFYRHDQSSCIYICKRNFKDIDTMYVSPRLDLNLGVPKSKVKSRIILTPHEVNIISSQEEKEAGVGDFYETFGLKF